MQLVLAPLVALVAALVLTPQVRRLAFRVGALDSPDQRKVHQGVMPRLGGLAVYLSFVAAVLIGEPGTERLWGLLTGATVIMAVGMLDDIYRLPARIKLAGQVLAAVSVLPFGIVVTSVSNPFATNPHAPGLYLGLFARPLTVLWLVAVINAVNLIDGLDGLASGTAFIAALTMAAVIGLEGYLFHHSVHPGVMGLALTLAAASLGFLWYNFHPARIFLGDGGSMLLGFLLASMAVMGPAKDATGISVIVPLVILGIPLADTLFAVVRRAHRHLPIMQPDREHLHHRLLDLGLNHRQAVLAIYGVNVVLGASAILLTVISQGQALVLAAGIFLAVAVTANRLGVTGQRFRTNYLKEEARRSRGM
ncbi:MAG: MraY family glycosyltransferase [Peptococcaceae bacterium]|nr:MraY family glycosyltransferase [Peptococcaceae bacterium]